MSNTLRKLELIWCFTILDVKGKYRSAYLGNLWSLLQAILMLGMYTFLFRMISRSNWESQQGSEAIMILFAGIIVFNVLSECLIRSPMLLISNRNYVKKFRFPIEILPISAVGSALFHFTVNLTVLLFGMIILGRMPSMQIVLLPVMLAPLMLLCLGISWILCLIGAQVRDLAFAMPFFSQILFFLTPIIYPLHSVPENIRPIFKLNILTVITEQIRATIFGGNIDWGAWLTELVITTAVCMIGYRLFMHVKLTFADML